MTLPNGVEVTKFRAVGASMYPALELNSTVLMVQYEGQDLCVGDIVVIDTEKAECGRRFSVELVGHRLVDWNEDGGYFESRGDNNLHGDGCKVEREDIRFVAIGVLY